MTTFFTLIAIGIFFIGLELFVPGGILGVVGLLCLGAAAVVGYQAFETDTANLILLGLITAVVVGALMMMRYFPRSRLGKRFTMQQTIGHQGHNLSALEGQEGTALTPLRPSGVARFGDKRVDVIADGGFVKKGQPIRVLEVQGNKVVVRESEPEA